MKRRLGYCFFTKTRNFSLASAVGLLSSTACASAQSLNITSEEMPPFNMNIDGKAAGISSEILISALDETHISYKISFYPWLRAYDMALKEPGTCVYSTTLTDERAPLFKWVGPLATDQWAVFAMADNPIMVNSLEDLRGHRIGTAKGDAFSSFLKSQGLSIDELVHPNAPANELNLRKLQSGRVDFWAAGQITGTLTAQQLGVANLKNVLTVRETALYMACNKSVPDDIIDTLNARIRKSAGSQK